MIEEVFCVFTTGPYLETKLHCIFSTFERADNYLNSLNLQEKGYEKRGMVWTNYKDDLFFIESWVVR